MAAPSKAEQEAEARARSENGLDPNERSAVDVIDDGDAGEGGSQRQQRQTETDGDARQEAPPVKGVFDQRRADIVARFRNERTQQAEEQRDDISDFARSGMPPDFEEATGQRQPQQDDAGADAGQEQPFDQQQAPALPKTVRVKVRGQEQDLPLEEVIAKAQIAMAADNYLDEAKGKLNEVDALLRDTRARAPRAGQDGEHHAGTESAQQHAEQTPQPGVDPQHPEDGDLDRLIETLQFGDPTEARGLLADSIRRRAQEAVQPAVEATLRNQRLKDEGARTAKVLADFEGQNPELASDQMARAAIERRIFDLQIEDLKAIGVDPAKIPTEGGRAITPADIALAHRFYRSEGYQVRSPADMLETAKTDFMSWRGVKKTNETASDPAQKGEPRVEISVDRAARRQTIPQQPSRTVSPRPDAQQQRPAPARDRSEIVQSMIAKRNGPRGRVTG
jgi:hypothetical protein